MKLYLWITLISLVISCKAQDFSAVQNSVNQAIENGAGPGISLSVYYQNQFWNYSAGYADANSDIKLGDDHRLKNASTGTGNHIGDPCRAFFRVGQCGAMRNGHIGFRAT